jgi:hypothetical protein
LQFKKPLLELYAGSFLEVRLDINLHWRQGCFRG